MLGGFQVITKPLIVTQIGWPESDAVTVFDSGSDKSSVILPV